MEDKNMGLFDNKFSNPFKMFEDEFLMEFDAGSGDTSGQDEELETIDADDTGDAQNTEPESDGEDDELETIDDDGETEEDQDGETPEEDQTSEGDPNVEENPDEELETIDDDPDGMESSEGEEGLDDTSSDDGGLGETPENDPHQRLKELEAEIFDQLSEQEKDIKKNELKKLFILLIEKSDTIVDLLQEVPKTDETIRLIDYVINTLTDLKTYLNDYVSNMYDIKTYLQNTVNFQKYLAIFDSVKAITEEIKRTSEEK